MSPINQSIKVVFIRQGYGNNTGGNKRKKQVKKKKSCKYTDITMSEWKWSFSRAIKNTLDTRQW